VSKRGVWRARARRKLARPRTLNFAFEQALSGGRSAFAEFERVVGTFADVAAGASAFAFRFVVAPFARRFGAPPPPPPLRARYTFGGIFSLSSKSGRPNAHGGLASARSNASIEESITRAFGMADAAQIGCDGEGGCGWDTWRAGRQNCGRARAWRGGETAVSGTFS